MLFIEGMNINVVYIYQHGLGCFGFQEIMIFSNELEQLPLFSPHHAFKCRKRMHLRELITFKIWSKCEIE